MRALQSLVAVKSSAKRATGTSKRSGGAVAGVARDRLGADPTAWRAPLGPSLASAAPVPVPQYAALYVEVANRLVAAPLHRLPARAFPGRPVTGLTYERRACFPALAPRRA